MGFMSRWSLVRLWSNIDPSSWPILKSGICLPVAKSKELSVRPGHRPYQTSDLQGLSPNLWGVSPLSSKCLGYKKLPIRMNFHLLISLVVCAFAISSKKPLPSPTPCFLQSVGWSSLSYLRVGSICVAVWQTLQDPKFILLLVGDQLPQHH